MSEFFLQYLRQNSQFLQHLLKQASVYLAEVQWPPVSLVDQIAGEAERIGIEPPIQYRFIRSPEDAEQASYFSVEPDTFGLRMYEVRSPCHEVERGIMAWYKKTPGTQSTRDSRGLEVTPVEVIAEEPPNVRVARAIRAWIEYLDAPAPAEPAAPPGENGDSSFTDLLSLLVGRKLANGEVNRVREIQVSNKTVDQKLWEIDSIIPIPATISAEDLSAGLRCSSTAIKRTSWWMENRYGRRKKRVAEGEERMRQRGKEYG